MTRLLLVLLLLLAPLPAFAHWADLAVAEVSQDGSDIHVSLTLPTGLLPGMDDNRDGHLSSSEAAAHAEALRGLVSQRIHLQDAAGRPARLQAVAAEDAPPVLAQAAAPRSTHTTLTLDYAWDSAPDGVRMEYDLFVPDAPAARCVTTFELADGLSTFAFTPTARSVTMGNGKTASKPGTLAELLNPETMLAGALAVAFVLGALHGLSPGHGKTVVAAYLVGSRGTVGQALLLGAVVTFTHTASVIVLGVLCMSVFRYGVPATLQPWIGVVSGLLVTGMGAWLLKSWRDQRPAARVAVAGATYAVAVGQAMPRPAGRAVLTRAAGADGGHWHGNTYHTHTVPARVTLGSLVALGVSGGMVPCPDALVVLLSAIAANQILLGIAIIVAFSLGLAAVLMAIGVAMVLAGRAMDRWIPSRGAVRWMSAASYVVIMLLGLFIAAQSAWSGGLL